MNRIRISGGKYQVLITPDYIHSSSFEVMIDNWLDSSFNNYYIKEFDNMQDSLYEALKYPDIDWYKLVSHHVENFKKLKDIVNGLITKYNFTVEFKPSLITPEELKNSMFDRIIFSRKQFNTSYGLNDIISFNITNNWTKNLEFIAKIFEKENSLNIYAKHYKDNAIYLSGRTDIGTSYTIILMPTLIYSVLKWLMKNKENTNADAIFDQIYTNAMEQQKKIDENPLVL